YNNFNEVLDEFEPDCILTISGDFEYLSRSMLKCCHMRKIPTVNIMSSVFEYGYFKKEISIKIITGRINFIRENGKNILKKYIFLLRTLISSGYSIMSIIKNVIKDIYLPLLSFEPRYNFGGATLNLVSNPKWRDFLINKGIDDHRIIVVGECSMDKLYNHINEIKKSMVDTDLDRSIGNIIRILLITTPMVEHGYWNSTMRDDIINRVLSSLTNNYGNRAIITIKIHPVHEKEITFQKIAKNLNSRIQIIKKADLPTLISESDLVIGYGITSAYFQVLLLKKPLVLINFFNEDYSKNIFLREKMAIECRNTGELIKWIDIREQIQIDDKKLAAIIHEIFYRFDGNCTRRAVEAICSLLHSEKY
ncbi:MAG: CDP-glycerol glycerophosphotransferase family protein, partial [Candidatus Nitrosocosmicus sp.]|nr:CDP-glycerol glycerophosphotransferase family protein [Candidatus Nitrosocosmicus sp.]